MDNGLWLPFHPLANEGLSIPYFFPANLEPRVFCDSHLVSPYSVCNLVYGNTLHACQDGNGIYVSQEHAFRPVNELVLCLLRDFSTCVCRSGKGPEQRRG